MRTVSVLSVLLLQLGINPLFGGNRSTQTVKTFNRLNTQIDRQLTALSDVVLGRKRTTSRKGNVRPLLPLTVEVSDDIPVETGVTSNVLYRQLRELLTSLEEDSVKSQNGDSKALTAFRKNLKRVRGLQASMRSAMGVSRVGKNGRKPRQVRAVVVPPPGP